MPSQLIHLEECAGALAALQAPAAGGAAEARGLCLLGAISPDAWAVAGCERAALHFWSLEDDTSGLIRLARAYPDLGDSLALPAPQRAFLAGYLCHLVTDEQWTLTVYRPYFGRRSPFGAAPEGLRLQQALQASLEQTVRDRRPHDLARWLTSLATARLPAAAALPFLAPEAIDRWRDLQLAASTLPTARAAFGFVLEQTAQTRRPGGAGGAAALQADWPRLEARVRAYVPEGALADFRARAGAACAAVLAAWWPYNGAP